jgi:hypothetical protein
VIELRSAASSHTAHPERFVGLKGSAEEGGNFEKGCVAGKEDTRPHFDAR